MQAGTPKLWQNFLRRFEQLVQWHLSGAPHPQNQRLFFIAQRVMDGVGATGTIGLLLLVFPGVDRGRRNTPLSLQLPAALGMIANQATLLAIGRCIRMKLHSVGSWFGLLEAYRMFLIYTSLPFSFWWDSTPNTFTIMLSRIAAGVALLAMSFSTPVIAAPKSPDSRFKIGELLFKDDFKKGLENWNTELENGGSVTAKKGQLEVDVPAGATVWFKPKIEGAVLIEYQAEVVKKGGLNDRVSDLNCFWMARDSRSENDIFAHTRNGKFADYNQLRTYYVGLGGNGNTTTRFRRYIGDADLRPLLPEHDLREAKDLIVANQKQTIQLVANGSLIQFYRDGRRIFELQDNAPYTTGWFGFRTVTSHLVFRQFRVYRLYPTNSVSK